MVKMFRIKGGQKVRILSIAVATPGNLTLEEVQESIADILNKALENGEVVLDWTCMAGGQGYTVVAPPEIVQGEIFFIAPD